MKCLRTVASALLLLLVVSVPPAHADAPPTRKEAAEALRKAVTFFREQVSTNGGYLWEYSSDLKQRRGEGKATPSQIWVQPPGTPSVGMAYLRAFERTGDTFYLDAACDAAHALVWGQLGSGGWAYSIDFDPARSKRYYYRRDVDAGREGPGQRYNTTTFDDDNSQSALRLLMTYDRTAGFKDEQVGHAARYALRCFRTAQYPNGAWPQRYLVPYDPKKHPVLPARYPETWSRTFTRPDYKYDYTLNDATIPDCIRTMLLAHEVYGNQAYLQAAKKGGAFLILAQMPDPQPAWAQQYAPDMTPAWARRFEPPAIVTVESVSAIRALMSLYVETGDDKYRKPIPRALDWMAKVTLPDGRHARFYELKTDRPIYFNMKYELVYTDDDLPTHYAFKTRIDVAGLRKQYRTLDRRRQQHLKDRETGDGEQRTGRRIDPRLARKVIDALDEKGRWIEEDRIQCSTFIRNVDILSAYVAGQTPRAAASTPTALRVMSFNIRYGTAGDGENHWEKRKDLVVGVIRDHQPDVIGLQEALRFQMDYIREKLPQYSEIGVGRDDGKQAGEYSPIFYHDRRFRIKEQGTFWLSDTPTVPGSRTWGNSIPRICTWGRFIDNNSGAAFYLFNTHLDHQSQPSRERGAELIMRRIRDRPHPDPVILTGDFNAGEDNPVIQHIKGVNTSAPAGDRAFTARSLVDTFRVRQPDAGEVGTFSGWSGQTGGAKIDYVFATRDVRVIEAAILHDHTDGRYPSDHYPVIAALRLPAR